MLLAGVVVYIKSGSYSFRILQRDLDIPQVPYFGRAGRCGQAGAPTKATCAILPYGYIHTFRSMNGATAGARQHLPAHFVRVEQVSP